MRCMHQAYSKIACHSLRESDRPVIDKKEDSMLKKTIVMLVILSFLGFSTGYAYDSEDDHANDQSANAAIVAAVVMTGFFLLAAHDWHEEGGGPGRYEPAHRPARHGGHHNYDYDGHPPFPPHDGPPNR